jgi:hypothetical protein
VLDEIFGQDGLVYTYISNLSDGVNDLVIQPDDKIILAGVSNHSNYGHTAIARYSNDGELDLIFANQEILDLDIGFGSSCQSVKLLSDTKIVALFNLSEG